MENKDMLIELLYDKVKQLEVRIENLEKQFDSKNKLATNDFFSGYEVEIRRLIKYLDEVYLNYKGEISLGIENLNEIMGLNFSSKEFESLKLLNNLNKVSKYFVVLQHNGVYHFNMHTQNIKQPGRLEIQKHIEKLIASSNDEYIEINALSIHKELKLTSRMPSVCAVMTQLIGANDEVIGGKNPSSTYTVRYKKR